MVPRYARPAMTAIWEPEARYRIWFEIEAHATQKLGELGVVPESGAQALWDWWATNPAIDVPAIDAYISAQVRLPTRVGLSIAIVKDGKMVLAKGYGQRSLAEGKRTEPADQ